MTVIIDGTNGVDKIAAGAIEYADLPTGSVLQVVSVPMTNTFTTSSQSYVDVTGLSATITPKFSTSKILVIAQVTYTGGNTTGGNFKLTGGNTASYIGDANSSNVRAVFGGTFNVNITNNLFSGSITYFDSPATASAVTYKVQTAANSAGNPSNVNIAIGADGSAASTRGASSITLMEIAA